MLPARARRARALLALSPLLLALAPPPGEAQGPGAIDLLYVVNAADPDLLAEGKVQVSWRASGFRDRVSAFCLQTDAHEYGVSEFGLLAPAGPWVYHPPPADVDPEGGKPPCPTGYRALVRDLDQVQAGFLLDVRKSAFTACRCEFNSFLGPSWGVMKAESLALAFSYAFFEGEGCTTRGCTFRARVQFLLPEGWSVETPWALAPGGGPPTFEISVGGPPLPRGFIALGAFTPEPHVAAADGKRFVYVRLAQELRDKATLFDYLEKATPYYQSVYGNVTGSKILVISAGPPMFTGGLGSTDSLFVHHNSSRETIAHEYAHVWQRFQTVAAPPETSIWLNEGDADLHGALSRFVTETQPGFTLDKLRADLRESYDEHSNDPDFRRALSDAVYGGPTEQVAYKKGLFTLLFLDQEAKRLTSGAAGLNQILREMNVHYQSVVAQSPGEKRLTNEDILGVVNRVVQGAGANIDLRNFFETYVWGPGWPPYVEAPAEVPIVLDGLLVEPLRVEPGSAIQARFNATNVGGGTETRALELLVDDRVVARTNITLAAGAKQVVRLEGPAGEPGDHTARVGPLRADYRVLTPANLRVEVVRAADPPQAGASFDLLVVLKNLGEQAARATVEATIGEQAKRVEVLAPGGQSVDATLPFVLLEEGAALAAVEVAWANRTATGSAQLTVGPRDRDLDGVPDAQDGYPDDPALSEKNPLNDLRNAVPGPAAWLLLALLAAVALASRRR